MVTSSELLDITLLMHTVVEGCSDNCCFYIRTDLHTCKLGNVQWSSRIILKSLKSTQLMFTSPDDFFCVHNIVVFNLLTMQ